MIYHPYGVFDNSPKEYKTIQALPLAAAMGAEVTGVNLAEISDFRGHGRGSHRCKSG